MDYTHYAILARTNKYLQYIAEELQARGYPIQIIGNQFDLMKQEEFRIIMALWKVVCNPHDTVHTQHLMIKPYQRYSSNQIQRTKYEAVQQQQPLVAMLDDAIYDTFVQVEQHMPLLDAYDSTIDGLQLVTYYQECNQPASVEKVEETYPLLLQTWCEQHPEYASVQGFIDWYALSSLQDAYDEDENAVTLSTVHGAKGLEWHTVFVAGMQQGLFPHKRGDLEEERRLGYVAVTRARDKLSVTGCQTNKREFYQSAQPSQFLREMQ